MKQLITNSFKPMVSSHCCNGFISSTKKDENKFSDYYQNPYKLIKISIYKMHMCGLPGAPDAKKNQADFCVPSSN